MRIKFRPITKIKRAVKGKYTTLFVPTKTYEGIKFADGSIMSDSPVSDKPIKINENDIIILELLT